MAETDIAGPSNAPSSENVTNDQEEEELKKELQRLVLEVIGGNQEDNDGIKVDHGVGNINKAIKALAALKKLNLERKERQLSSLYDHLDVLCPISKEMMRDPVILSTGQTYDRPSIYKWLKDVQQICPHARDVISHAVFTPNHLVWEQIQQWCKANNVQLLPPTEDLEEEVVVTISVEDSLNGFLQRLSTLSDQKQAAKEIRLLTKSNHSIRPYFSESADAIPQLLSPLSLLKNLYDHPDLQEDLVTVVLNISLHDGNKKIVCEYPLVIPLVIESLTCGTIDTRANAAAALSALSSLDSNKKLIGEKGDYRSAVGASSGQGRFLPAMPKPFPGRNSNVVRVNLKRQVSVPPKRSGKNLVVTQERKGEEMDERDHYIDVIEVVTWHQFPQFLVGSGLTLDRLRNLLPDVEFCVQQIPINEMNSWTDLAEAVYLGYLGNHEIQPEYDRNLLTPYNCWPNRTVTYFADDEYKLLWPDDPWEDIKEYVEEIRITGADLADYYRGQLRYLDVNP